jgi:PAS domain S-box-containing protein
VEGRVDLSRLVIAIVDITEQKRAEALLRGSEERFRTLFEQAADSIVLLDAETGKLLEFNDRACKNLGYTREELQNLRIADFEVIESPEDVSKHFETIIAKGSDVFETQHRTKQGEIRDILVSAKALSMPGKKLISSIWRDITEQKRSQEALRKSEERYRRLVEHMNTGMAVVDENFVLTYANDKLCEMGGYAREELIGRPAIEFVGESSRTSFHEQMARRRAGARESTEATFVRADGRELVVMQSAEPLFDSSGRFRGSFAVMTDITEQKQVEHELRENRDELELRVEGSLEQLRRSERLASIGTLASGIAHEINNPLGMIQLVAETALGATGDPERVEEMLGQIISDVTRCSHIVKSVLRFAKEQPTEKWTNDLNDIIRHSLDLTREYATRHGVIVAEQLCEELPPVRANPTDLEQVFVNLISNAVNACESGGRVELETAKVGDRVRVIVRDDGRGMAKEHVERAFDPFYTTRLEQGGTGLGLSTCHGIVTDHRGEIEIVSKERQGTAIIIELPIADMHEEGVPA